MELVEVNATTEIKPGDTLIITGDTLINQLVTVKKVKVSNNDGIETIIESFRAGAADYIIKDSNVFRKVNSDIYWKITEPLRRMGKEFELSKYMAILIATIVLMAVIIAFIL